jgi:NAD(P)-dependent dehydrogenase (short-subunit alcohol dehydrogenase family)
VADRFTGKQALVLGVANKRSIAWGIAKRLADGGAELAFTYQGERIEKTALVLLGLDRHAHPRLRERVRSGGEASGQVGPWIGPLDPWPGRRIAVV